jgi:formylglycine-generating enzyme required for sulfatase activity
VDVGDINNPADPTTGFGSVGYAYRISAHETTIGQYTEFLNATAASDPYGLYHSSMGSDANIAGIARTGSSGSYSYSVIGSADRPVTYVSWFDAARYTNWLHNGQGSGSTETGAYTLNGATSGIFTRNMDAAVWIPSEDEWYKAAYYDPTPGAGGGDNYWLYPMQSDTLANNSVSANYFDGDYAVTQSGVYSQGQNYLTGVGAYAGQDSFYGTFDQGGNVAEWNEAVSGS